MAIYLIRHTTPLVPEGTCYGQTDLPVGATFVEEAERVRALFPEPGRIGHLYSSPLDRCLRLARHLWPVKPILTVEALKEMHFGEWEYKPWSDIDRPALDAWMQDFVHAVVPGGENYTILQQRVVAWWTQTALAPSTQTAETLQTQTKETPQSQTAETPRPQTTVRNPDDTVIITHAGVIRSLLCHCTGVPLGASFETFPVPFGGVYRLEEENGRWETRLL